MKELKLKVLNSELTMYVMLGLVVAMMVLCLFYGSRLVDNILFYKFNI